LSRTTISGSSAIVIVNQSPGLGMRDARPTHSHSWANSESYSKRRLGRQRRRVGDVGSRLVEQSQQVVGQHARNAHRSVSCRQFVAP